MSANGDSSTRPPSPSSSESLSDEQTNSETLDFSAWCHFSPEPASESEALIWDAEEQQEMPKIEEESLRILEEMLKTQNRDPIMSESTIAVNPSVFHLPQSQPGDKAPLNSNVFSNFSSDNSSSESALVPDLIPHTISTMTMPTRVVPPPPVQPRRVDNSMHHRVIFPVKESCYNLAIITSNVPASGTKSRVETQVRVAIDLALPCGSSGDPQNYDKVGSWRWLKLPNGTATRKRSRKEGNINASPPDTLFMDIEVTCASNPSKQVLSCSTCQGREAKRVARKIAARVRPARSDSESNEGDSGSYTKIVQFNCPDILDFSGGSVVLPLRITCYCRHHREKVGFNVHFTMRDAGGRLIGKGMSPPIMITDDHKSSDKSASKQAYVPPYLAESDWEPRTPLAPTPSEPGVVNTGVPRRRSLATKDGATPSKRRGKPYDMQRTAPGRARRPDPGEGEGSGQPTVDTTVANCVPMDHEYAVVTPFSPFSVFTNSGPTSPASQRQEIITALPSPSNSNHSPVSPQVNYVENTNAMMQEVFRQPYGFLPLSPPETAPSSPPSHSVSSSSSSGDISSFAYNTLYPVPDPPLPSLPAPKIHRLIPSSGPTYGGIEVTVLGSNFHPSVLYNCVFGDAVASSTARWSENTLVCILPPRATAGVVPVTLEGQKLESGGAPALFTYVDETDRTLMELALQVVGLKMTGKVEDAKDIAMRIVGSSQESQGSTGNTSQMMNLASSALPDSRRLFLGCGDDVEFEKTIMDSLSSLDMRDSSGERRSLSCAISHPTKTGQTLLHLAASLGFSSLVEFLIQRDITIDAQDINGYTALHAAVLNGSQCCARQLVNAGADVSIYTKMGYTALEFAPEGFFTPAQHTSESLSEESDDESFFGDVEDDSGEESRPHSFLQTRRRVRHPRSRRPSKPASVISDASDVEDPFDDRAVAEDDDNATVVSPEVTTTPDGPEKDMIIDEKQAASFAAYLQRAWAQLQPPHLRPYVPHLRDMPAWVYPVFVPIQAWPPFRSGKHIERDDAKNVSDEGILPPSKHSWEEWMDEVNAEHHMNSASGKLDPEEVAPEVAIAPTPGKSRSLLRRFRSSQKPVQVSANKIKAYSYRPKSKANAKTPKKEDRMLIIFWIPIMILALLWALYASRPVISGAKQYIPWDDIMSRLKAAI